MKFQLSACLLALVAFSPLAMADASGPSHWAITGVAADDMLNIRTKKDHKSQRIGRIPANAVCVQNLRIYRDSRWRKIKYAGVIGFVNGRYLRGSDANCGPDARPRREPVAKAPRRAEPRGDTWPMASVDDFSAPIIKSEPIPEPGTQPEPSEPRRRPLPVASVDDFSVPIAKSEPIPEVRDTTPIAKSEPVPAAPIAKPSPSPRRVEPNPNGELQSYAGVTNLAADEKLNVRKMPRVGAKKVGQLTADASCIRITRRNKDASWVHIEHGALSGWVSTKYLGSVDKYDCFLKFPRGL